MCTFLQVEASTVLDKFVSQTLPCIVCKICKTIPTVPRQRIETRVQVTHIGKKGSCEIQSHNPLWTQDRISQVASTELDKSIGRALVSKNLK